MDLCYLEANSTESALEPTPRLPRGYPEVSPRGVGRRRSQCSSPRAERAVVCARSSQEQTEQTKPTKPTEQAASHARPRRRGSTLGVGGESRIPHRAALSCNAVLISSCRQTRSLVGRQQRSSVNSCALCVSLLPHRTCTRSKSPAQRTHAPPSPRSRSSRMSQLRTARLERCGAPL